MNIEFFRVPMGIYFKSSTENYGCAWWSPNRGFQGSEELQRRISGFGHTAAIGTPHWTRFIKRKLRISVSEILQQKSDESLNVCGS